MCSKEIGAATHGYSSRVSGEEEFLPFGKEIFARRPALSEANANCQAIPDKRLNL